jgi:hypothetical protein
MAKRLTFTVTLTFADNIKYPEKVAEQVLIALDNWRDSSEQGLSADSNETFTTSILVKTFVRGKPIITFWSL